MGYDIVCEKCGDIIATFRADTVRQESNQEKDAVCKDCCNKSDNTESDILEKLADLEHKQWMHWSKYVAENYDIPEELEKKWEKSWKPYEELSEEMKDKDRKWARKVLEIIED